MFNKGYTPKLNKILKELVQEEAKRFNSDRILPEHLILTILKSKDGIAIKILENLYVQIDQLIEKIENHIEKNEGPIFLGDVALSIETQQILELAGEEARNMGYNYIGTEHIIIAAISDPNSFLAQTFKQYNVTSDKLREEIVKLLGFGRVLNKKETIKKSPTLDEFGRDLTEMARKGKIGNVIGREKEIERIVQVLSRRSKNNPVLIGEPGVGKTAIVEGLAIRIVENNVPDNLIGKRVVALDLAQVVAGTKYRGEFEERLKKIMKEIVEVENVILFIDELHTIIGAGAAEGAIDASNMLKPALSRGEIQCIGATTLNEYKKYIEKDAALERRFQPIYIDEPTVEDTIKILKGIKHLYESHHNVVYTERAVELAAILSHRYISDRFLPDKAIDLLDEAGASVKLKKSVKPIELVDIEKDLEMLINKEQKLIKELQFEECEKIRGEIKKLIKKKENFVNKKQNSGGKFFVDEKDIFEIVSNITKIPLSKIAEEENNRLLKIEEELHKRIIGQDDAILSIANAIRRSRLGLASKKRPIGSFIFLGPTGVGKTEVAKGLAEFLFGNQSALIRIDMSDFMEKHNVSRLVGAPPGYVGYEEGGILTEKIRRHPYSVILLDEIEKAHPDVFNILLQILEEGELADNLGHIVSFKNTIIIMTSNVGARTITSENIVGFTKDSGLDEYKNIKNSAINELKRVFNPEFLNRVDEIVVFHPLSKENLLDIIDIMFKEIKDNLKEKNINIELTEKAKNFIINKYYDKKYGARTLRRALQKDIADIISIEILNKRIKDNDNVLVDIKNENGIEELTFIKNPENINFEKNENESKKEKRQKVLNK